MRCVFLVIAAVVISALGGAACSSSSDVVLVSVDDEGNPADLGGHQPAVSADGRCVAFRSISPNLHGEKIDSVERFKEGIFVRDLDSNRTVMIASEYSQRPSVSSDGRIVAFESAQSDLVPRDTNEASDVFVFDASTGETSRVSVSSTGSEGNSHSFLASISANGRYVAFTSSASKLVERDTNDECILPPDDSIGCLDVFVRDRVRGETTRVSVDSAGKEVTGSSYDPAISADGRYVAFVSSAGNLVRGDNNPQCDINGDGLWEENCEDIFVHDRETGETTLVSVVGEGTQGNGRSVQPAISGDGRYVAFVSESTNFLADTADAGLGVFVRDRGNEITYRVAEISRDRITAIVGGWGFQVISTAAAPAISADGKRIAFWEPSGIFVSDMDGGNRQLVSGRANSGLDGPAISADGQYVALASFANPETDAESGPAQVYRRKVALFEHDLPTAVLAALAALSAVALTGGLILNRLRSRSGELRT